VCSSVFLRFSKKSVEKQNVLWRCYHCLAVYDERLRDKAALFWFHSQILNTLSLSLITGLHLRQFLDAEIFILVSLSMGPPYFVSKKRESQNLGHRYCAFCWFTDLVQYIRTTATYLTRSLSTTMVAAL
jgi:hypothetical protein